jgi:3-oxoacyl-[acyl-carrier-protein] synthase-3
MRNAAVTATACALPTQVLTNAELIERFGLDTTPEWIEAKTGIQTRHWLEDDRTTSDLAVEAAEKVLRERGIDAADVDRIVLATISPDMISPATATIVAHRLGARCPAFDVSAACAGFLYALDLAVGSIRGGEDTVLVIAADARSRFVDKHERRGAVLFADGAAAVLVEAATQPGVLSVHIGADGCADMGTHVPAGGARRPATIETVQRGEHFIVVDPSRDIYDNFVRLTREACDGALGRAGLVLDDVDVFIAHQGNARMVEMVARDLGLPDAHVVNDVHRHGNTAGATVPIALAESRATGRIGPGDTVLLASVGAGYTFGAAVLQF